MISFKTPLILASTAVLGLTACVTSQGPNDPNRTRQGALIGSVGGALAGAALDADDGNDRLRNAAIGAVVGGGAGAVGGAFLDAQERELRQQLGTGIVIQNTGNELIVRLPQDILFATDSAAVQPGLRGDLQLLANSLNKYDASVVEIQGHTDSTGSDAYNQNLSQRRAQAVSSILVQNGVSPARLRAVGYGESQPIATNDTAAGRQQNRRVSVVIRPTN
ncbi:OmpA family protein [Palleronia abyssalis]|uniref:Outer membrane porin F n=1 Tax=Palleronia abyssalis TaxID=1501240 RepID=A0A2R8BWA4_9RHOB|nr:OmpA family protein [Palleronia abyssalis]SPJ24449.1 Outer membrane porin F [Palleronia abyssalis]